MSYWDFFFLHMSLALLSCTSMQQYSLNLYLKYGKWVIFMGNYFLFIDILFSHVLISQTLWFIEMHVHRAAFSI